MQSSPVVAVTGQRRFQPSLGQFMAIVNSVVEITGIQPISSSDHGEWVSSLGGKILDFSG
jgi:hypothetical protein